MASSDGTGAYRGARYTRTWFTLLAEVPVLSGIYFAVLLGSDAWVVLAPIAVVIAAALWLVPLSVVSTDGVRLVLGRETVAWRDIAAVLDPRTGDEEARVELAGGRVLALPGVPPEAVPDLRRLWNAAR
jgi:hypothetical protein